MRAGERLLYEERLAGFDCLTGDGVVLGVRRGDVDDVHVGVVENLFASDLAFLQDLYRQVNQEGHTHAAVTCPECAAEFTVDVAGGRLGGS